jgi:hypothetical protein
VLARVAAFSVPKKGCAPEEVEDAWWVGPDGCGDGPHEGHRLSVSVSDGASESLLAGRWAQRLAATVGAARGATRTRAGFVAAYREAAGRWTQEMADYTADREARGAPIQWYEEPGLAKGAYATLVALEVLDRARGPVPRWRAAALGDSCLFQVREDRLHVSFPVKDSAAFSNQPPLLASRGIEDEAVRRHTKLCAGDWMPGDTFYVATDALAAWFLRGAQSGERPWAPLRGIAGGGDAGDGAFAAWVEDRREGGELHDDDTTLVRIELD